MKIQNNRHRSHNYELARWMQPDPLGVVPEDYYNDFDPEDQYSNGVNVYSYVNNMPLYYSDPLGLWDADIHRTLTQQLAEKAGLGNCTMKLQYSDGTEIMGNIGDGANWADDNPILSPPGTTFAYYLSFINPFVSGDDRKVLPGNAQAAAPWHFPLDNGIVIPGGPASRKMMEDGLSSCDLTKFAKGIHIFQDSWCHQGRPIDDNTHMGHARGAKLQHEGQHDHNGFGIKTKAGYRPIKSGFWSMVSLSTDNPRLFGHDIHEMSKILYEDYLLPFRDKCPCACGGKPMGNPYPKFDPKWIPYKDENVVDFDYMTNTYRN